MKGNNHVHDAKEDSEQSLTRHPIIVLPLRTVCWGEEVLDLVVKGLSCGKDRIDNIAVNCATADGQIVSLDRTTVVHGRSIMTRSELGVPSQNEEVLSFAYIHNGPLFPELAYHCKRERTLESRNTHVGPNEGMPGAKLLTVVSRVLDQTLRASYSMVGLPKGLPGAGWVPFILNPVAE